MDFNTLINRLNIEKEKLQEQIKQKQQELNEIEIVLKNLLKYKKELQLTCEKCGGKGKVFHRSCAEDEGSYYTCEQCRGTGKIEL